MSNLKWSYYGAEKPKEKVIFQRISVSGIVFTRNLTAPLRCCQQFVFHQEKQPVATSKQAGQTAYYVRVSSQSQDIRSQIPEMEAHAQGQDSARWYTDTFTGTQMDRPG